MKTARLALAIVLALQGVALAAPAQKSFASLDDAVNALVATIRAADRKALVEILGPQGTPLVWSGDAVADRAAFQRFVAAYDRAHRLQGGGGQVVLYVGDDGLLNRRIGKNELSAIQVCLAYVDAQRE